MPSKFRRAASRQSQLKRKRQRGKSRSQEFDAGPTEPAEPASTLEAEEGAEVVAVATAPQQAVRPAPRSRRPSSGETPLTYPYLGSEIKQIGAISALIVIILVVLAFVLGS